jgi:methylamine--corrinoid protein Co-methyltransferase
MAFKEKVGVFETYDRARNGPKVDEKEWDRKITYKTANKLKEKYKLNFDRSKIIPTDTDMIDRLYQAGLEMLVEMGVFCMDTGRVDDPRPPLNQGGPTGAPVSENIFIPMHEAYAREPLVDAIVNGVLSTINGREPKPGSPWEIAAVKGEVSMIRMAMTRAGRPGMAM